MSAVALLLLPALAHAAFPGANGKIAFYSNRDGDNEIYSINPDGTGEVKLTENTCSDMDPAWSPDGSRIAFVRFCGSGTNHVWVMNADGTAQTELASTVVSTRPAWSPDGTRITYERFASSSYCGEFSCAGAETHEIWTVNEDGTGAARVPGDGCPPIETYFCSDSAPAWSEADRIAFARRVTVCYEDSEGEVFCSASLDQHIWSMRPDGSDARHLGGSGDHYSPDWSPDAAKLAFSIVNWGSETGLWTTDADGTGRSRVLAFGDGPVWSPDRTRIAFEGSGIQTISPDGSGLTTVATPGKMPDWQPLRALDPFPRPGGATPLRVPLVPSYQQCTAPNSRHVPPLDEPSCTPPALTSQVLTTSSVGRGQGSARLDVILGNSATPADEADVRIIARAFDVRCAATNSACPGGAGSDFTGKLALTAAIRLTDRNSGFGGVSATVSDARLQAPLDCSTTTDTTLGSTCAVTTTADSLIPGFITEQKRSVISTFTLTIDDPGPNGSGYGPSCPPDCGDGDEAPYLTQGVFTGL